MKELKYERFMVHVRSIGCLNVKGDIFKSQGSSTETRTLCLQVLVIKRQDGDKQERESSAKSHLNKCSGLCGHTHIHPEPEDVSDH